MKINQTIEATFQFSVDDRWLTAYQSFIGNEHANMDDFFLFITSPAPQRDEFYIRFCETSYTYNTQVFLPLLTLKQ